MKRKKRRWLVMFLAVCIVFGLQSGAVSAAGEKITVNGTDILSQPDHAVSCGSGTATYDPATKTLTLRNAVINQDKGLPGLAASGIYIAGGGLSVENARLKFVFEDIGDANSYAIDIRGKDNLISNSHIEIVGQSSSGPEQKMMGINAIGAASLVISGQSNVIMKDIDEGISAGEADVKVLGSTLSAEVDNCAIACQNLEIRDDAEVNVSVNQGVALMADGKVTVSGATVSAESKQSNGVMCRDLEIKDSSDVTAKGKWPGLYAVDSVVIEGSAVTAEATNDVSIFSESTITLKDSEVTASDSILANGNVSIVGGKTEIGEGKISSGQDIYIGGVVTSNGTPSYDNIESGASGKEEYLGADYSAVDAAIAMTESLKKEDYVNFDIVEDAVNAVVRGKDFREQDVVNGYAAAIEAAVEALEPVSALPDTYQIIEGANQTIIIGKNNGVTIKADGDIDKFTNVLMDGQEVAKENYTAASGSTIITLKPEYVDTLPEGVHTVTINYTDGMAETKLTLIKAEDQTAGQPGADGTTPGTGDRMPIGWIITFAASGMVVLLAGRYKRKML